MPVESDGQWECCSREHGEACEPENEMPKSESASLQLVREGSGSRQTKQRCIVIDKHPDSVHRGRRRDCKIALKPKYHVSHQRSGEVLSIVLVECKLNIVRARLGGRRHS